MAKTLLARGDTLGDYKIRGIIRIDNMRVVYRAAQLSGGRQVALEVIEPQLNTDARFRREGKCFSALDHPNIQTVFESGEADGYRFVAMRLVQGTTLADRLQAEGMTADETLACLTQIASALETAHSLGFLHGDVKPENIVISQSGRPYLADFGVTKGFSAAPGSTRSSAIVGNVDYAAPEQILGGAPTAARDIYALTAVLYECLTGEVPFPRDNDADVEYAHLHEPPPRLRLNGDRVVELDRVIRRGMAKEGVDRWLRATDITSRASSVIDRIDGPARFTRPAFRASPGGSRFGVESFAGNMGAEALAGEVEPPAGPGSASGEPETIEITPELITGAATASVPVAVTTHVTTLNGVIENAPTGALERATRGSITKFVLFGGCAVVLLGAVAVGLALSLSAPTARHPSHPVARETLRSGPIRLTYSAPWLASTRADGVTPAFSSNSAITDGPVSLTAGALRESAPIPGGLPADLGRPVPSGAVELDGKTARAYNWTSDGKATMAIILGARNADLGFICTAPTAAALRSCTALSQTASVTGAQVIAPGAPRSEISGLRVALAPLSGARRQLAAMGRKSLVNRASIAAVLSRVDGHAATAVEKVPILRRSRSLQTALVHALHGESSLFARLSGAAHGDQRARFTGLSARLTRQSRAVAAAVRAFKSAGILVTPPILVSVPAPPVLKRVHRRAVASGGTTAPSSSDTGAYESTGSGASTPSTPVYPAQTASPALPTESSPAPPKSSSVPPSSSTSSSPVKTSSSPVTTSSPVKTSSSPTKPSSSPASSSSLPSHKGLPSTINLGG